MSTEIDLPMISLDDLSIPMQAATEMTKIGVFLKMMVQIIYNNGKGEHGEPPDSLLPWVKEYRQTVKDIWELENGVLEGPDHEKSIRVIVDVYNTIQSDLPEEARVALARVALQRHDAQVIEAEVVDDAG